MKFARAHLLLSILLVLISTSAFGQGAPFSGPAPITLTPNPSTPYVDEPVTVDLRVNLTGITGTCEASGVPAVLGAYVIPIDFDNARLSFVSASSCGNPQFNTAPTATDPSTANSTGTVTVSSLQLDTSSPTGNICVASLTFMPIASGSANLLPDHTDLGFSLASADQGCSEGDPASIDGTGSAVNVDIQDAVPVPVQSLPGLVIMITLLVATGVAAIRLAR